MKSLVNSISEIVSRAFVSAGYEDKFAVVTVSNRPDLCEYQCNGAMGAAKAYHKAPIAVANEVVEILKTEECFDKAEAVMPGFINITLTQQFLLERAAEMIQDADFGYEPSGNGKTAVIDYGGPNVAKPLHIGHLRSAIIGESLKRMLRFDGWNAIGDAHLGDWGLPIGLIIMELEERQPELIYLDADYIGEYPKEAPFTVADLEEIYPAASGRSKTDEEFRERARQATAELQAGRTGYIELWKHIIRISIEDLKKNYDKLQVSFEYWKKESDVAGDIQGLIEYLKSNGYARLSEGALVVDVKEETDTKEVPPCIVLKSDGAALYGTTDIATIVEREKLFKPDAIIYVVDKRQGLHFEQVFRASRKSKLVRPEVELNFIGFGTMNGKDGKPFKTRDGGVMRLERLLSDINEEAYKKIMGNREMEEDEARKIAEIVGLSALKYGDLSNQATKDYNFDLERFVSFEGETGPYILYTMVRIKSILNKFAESDDARVRPDIQKAMKYPRGAGEKALLLSLSRFQETMCHAVNELAPHKLCQYIYTISNEFNHFYHETKIITEENKELQESWIALLNLTEAVLGKCIELLGFSAPDKM